MIISVLSKINWNIGKFRYICKVNHVEIFKALASPTRLQILDWLKTPENYFPDQQEPFSTGVCVGQIQKKSGLTQSTISENLSAMQRAGLVSSTRKGQWTYYKRNEEMFRQLSQYIATEI
jgi:ArsR family transcriptional regulator